MIIMPFSYTTMARPKKSEHYVNNKDFLAALEQYAIDIERVKIYVQEQFNYDIISVNIKD